jgi:hypothetical protein
MASVGVLNLAVVPNRRIRGSFARTIAIVASLNAIPRAYNHSSNLGHNNRSIAVTRPIRNEIA